MRPVSLFAKLGLALLIFFSLQGEVVQRYIQLFHGHGQPRLTVSKKTAERLRVNKLQCYTQKFIPVGLPGTATIEAPAPLGLFVRRNFSIFLVEWMPAPAEALPSLRGPPAQVG